MRKNKITIITTYAPRQCGIATYSQSLITAIESNKSDVSYDVIAIDNDERLNYGKVVKMVINQDSFQDYSKAADYINSSDTDLVLIEHEFKIFGGFNGRYVLELLRNLKKPAVMTLHTVPVCMDRPVFIRAKRYKSRLRFLKKVSAYVSCFTVMTKTAQEFLKRELNLDDEKVVIVPHGMPPVSASMMDQYRQEKDKISVNKADILLTTFGLIMPKKGLEYAIKALPEIIGRNQGMKIIYLIAGRVHPDCPKSYLTALKTLASELGVEKNLVFDSKFLQEEEIYRYLANTDIYITPYYSKELASSGTLSYAIGCGCPIISTPYIHAQDVINNHQVGRLVKFRDPKSIADAANALIEDESLRQAYRQSSWTLGQLLRWKNVGLQFINLFNERADENRTNRPD